MQQLPKYMHLRRQGYYAILEIPKALRPVFSNKPRFIQSLKTREFKLAERRLPIIVAGWKTQLEKAKGSNSEAAGVLWELEQWRKQIESIDDPEHKAVIESVAYDEVERITETKGEHAAQQAYSVIFAKAQPLESRIDEWMASIAHLNAKTRASSKRAVLELCKQFKTTADITKASVKDYLSMLRTEKQLSDKTLSVRLTFIRSFIGYLDEKYETELLPLFSMKAVGRTTNAKTAKQRAWVPFVASDVSRLYQAAIDKADHALADLIACAAYTGCRIEELGKIKVDHITDNVIRIVDSKTAAGLREVPIHPTLASTIQRLKESAQSGYIIAGSDKGSYGNRTGALGKRFGLLKKKLGFGEQHVFHSIRKAVVSQLEQAGVSENTTADIVGHDKPRITYGLYSAGSTVAQKAEAIGKITYAGQLSTP